MTPHFLHAPITYAGLVVESTSRCNAACGMCYQGAGAKGSDYIGDHALSIPDMERAIVDALRVPTLTPKFHIAGGESFIKFADCVHLLRHARDAGYADISATSNAYWAADSFKARRCAFEMRQAGLNRLEISWDVWHQPYIAPTAINNALRACHAAGIETNLRLLTTRDHSVEEALDVLDYQALARVSALTSGPVFAVGRAAGLPRETIFSDGEQGACHGALHLTVNARGDVAPCCAGFEQTDARLFGNIRSESIVDIAARMNNSLLLRFVVFEGISSLRGVLASCGETLDDDYTGICHMCWDIFAQPERVRLLTRHFEALQERALDRAMHDLDARNDDGDLELRRAA